MVIVNLKEHKPYIHPQLYKILEVLNEGGAHGVDYELLQYQGNLRISESWRSADRQKELYNQGRLSDGLVVTNARPYESYHNWGLAVDLILRKGYDFKGEYNGVQIDHSKVEDWDKSGVFSWLVSQGLTWGGTWGDAAHVELRIQVPKLREFADNVGKKWVAKWWQFDDDVAMSGLGTNIRLAVVPLQWHIDLGEAEYEKLDKTQLLYDSWLTSVDKEKVNSTLSKIRSNSKTYIRGIGILLILYFISKIVGD